MGDKATQREAIVAIATPPGMGGIGVIRISGKGALAIGEALTGKACKPRQAMLSTARGANEKTLDQGIALAFPAPASFTGEDVFEFQGHGSPVVLSLLVKRCCELGARHARPGEFSERAFLNDKLDLAQAEAIADLIESQTETAARAALRSLQGEFSQQVQQILDELIALRVFVEAAIDFPEEEIDFLQENDIAGRAARLLQDFDAFAARLQRGRLLRDALKVVLLGPPNAGKSSLLNALAQDDRAIVSAIPGTTRDTLEQHIQLDGLPVTLTDTAGLRRADKASDTIEREGIRRARNAVHAADLTLICVDDTQDNRETIRHIQENELPTGMRHAVIHNKSDLSGLKPKRNKNKLWLSAKTGEGVALLCEWLRQAAGFSADAEGSEGDVLARQRHIDALERARQHIQTGLAQYQKDRAGEILAEELSLAQRALGEITGEFSADDLLGEIFGNFCIGK